MAGCAAVGLVLGVSVYLGLIGSGVVRNPLEPAIAGNLALARSERPGLRVLFVGNSFTARNGMPELVGELAKADADGPPVFAVQYAAPGWRLRRAAEHDGLARLLADVRWDVVVLQEQSRLPSLPDDVLRRETLPYADALGTRIEQVGARPVLFMTWGYADGDEEYAADDTFDAMQTRLAAGYAELAVGLSASVAPVGLAWAEALRRDPALELWSWDGKHPSRLGSYLAACVFYAVLTGRDPRASGFTGGLERAEARLVQQVAHDVVRS